MLKLFLAIIFPLLKVYCIGWACLRANRISHISTTIALDGHLKYGRRRNNTKRAHHHTHPAGNTGRFVNIHQAGFRISSHGPIGACIQAGRLLAMSALKGKTFPLHKHPGHRLGFFVYGLWKLLGHRCDFGPAPKLTLMASCTFFRIDFYDLQFFLLNQISHRFSQIYADKVFIDL